MDAIQAQMNVRIDADKKSRGDAVLSKFGLSPSYAVRSLWDYLASSKSLPAFMTSKDSTDNELERSSLTLAEEGAGLAARLAREAGLRCRSFQEASYEELREAAYEERLEAWERSHV